MENQFASLRFAGRSIVVAAIALLCNLASGTQAAAAALISSAGEQARIRLEATDLAGAPITSTPLESDFQIRGYVQDLRANGLGVFSAYMDIAYDPTLSSVQGAISVSTFDPLYRTFWDGNVATPGLVNEIGSAATDVFAPPGPTERLQFVLLFHADTTGIAAFTLNAAETDGYDVLLFGTDMPVPFEEVELVHAMLNIVNFVAGDTAPFDGVVDVHDLNNVRNHFGEIGDPLPGVVSGDVFPFDGKVDEYDLSSVRRHFGAGTPNPVPEPPPLVLLAAGAAGLAVLRLNRKAPIYRAEELASKSSQHDLLRKEHP